LQGKSQSNRRWQAKEKREKRKNKAKNIWGGDDRSQELFLSVP